MNSLYILEYIKIFLNATELKNLSKSTLHKILPCLRAEVIAIKKLRRKSLAKWKLHKQLVEKRFAILLKFCPR
jgi:hypothetical protein